jgi:hypothetical protein
VPFEGDGALAVLPMEEPAPGREQPVEDQLGRLALGIDLALKVQIAFLALHADGQKALVEPVVLQKGGLIEHLPHVLNAVTVDQRVELLLLQHLQLHVHAAVLANRPDLLLLHPRHYLLQVEVLPGQVVPVDRDPLGGLVDPLVPEDPERLVEQFLPELRLVLVHLLLPQLPFLRLDSLALDETLVVLVLVDQLTAVEPEIFLCENPVQIVDDPVLVVQHEVVLDRIELQVGRPLVDLQIFVYFVQIQADRVRLLPLVESELHGGEGYRC